MAKPERKTQRRYAICPCLFSADICAVVIEEGHYLPVSTMGGKSHRRDSVGLAALADIRHLNAPVDIRFVFNKDSSNTRSSSTDCKMKPILASGVLFNDGRACDIFHQEISRGAARS